MKQPYFPAMTGVRALAAFLLVIHHGFNNEFNSGYINSIIRELNVGVNMFFTLSGFLIWYRYSEKSTLKRNWIRPYFIKRFARIYPLYFFLTSITFFLIFIFRNPDLPNLLKIYGLNITFLNGFSTDYVYSGLPQGWTLTVEELFYISMPLIIFMNLNKRVNLSIIGIGIIVVGALLFSIFSNFEFFGFFNDIDYMRITTFFGRFTEFFAGILLAKFVMYKKIKKLNFPLFTIFGLSLIVISISFFLPSFQTNVFDYSIQSWSGYLFNVLVFPIFVIVFFYGLITEKSWISKALSSNFAIFLGKSSYALYLIHAGIIIALITQFITQNKLFLILISYVLSFMLWYLLEEPANKFIRKLA